MTVLDLDTNSLTGSIPCELGNLYLMQGLYFNDNSLTGSIPSELENLQLMQQLYFDSNFLTGFIPCEMGNLSSLSVIGLDSNSLTGSIPCELGNLQAMQIIYLEINSLTGTIPSELDSLQSLQGLLVYVNFLTGSLPRELGNLQSLQYLLLYDNYLTGFIPKELKNLSSMEILVLNSNQLTGVLVSDLFSLMSQLLTLDLSENSLSGSIPNDLAQLNKSLSILFLNNNRLTGTVPQEIANCTSLGILDLSFNYISGDVTELVILPFAEQISADGNLFSGSMPEANFGFLLESVDLSGNYIEGSLGFQFSNCFQLESIGLSDNLLKGTIPGYLYDLPSLISLNVSRNELSGGISLMSSSGSLKTIDVSSNNLSGILPPQLFGMPSLILVNASGNRLSGRLSGFNLSKNGLLKSLDVSSNRLTGTLPLQLFELQYLKDVLLYSNCFSGSLPETLCSSTSLEYLVMNELTSNCGSAIPRLLRPILQGEVARQLMKGSIPDCIWGLTSLKVLQLSGNGLTGSIGDGVNGSSLKSLLLSGNQLTGTIPAWVQQSSTLQQFDLSQNRLSGDLSSSLVISSTSSLFRASTNRLSGYLPGALFSTTSNLSLDVLNGNNFACSSVSGVAAWGSFLTPENLPNSDESHATYICGSNLFDDYLLLSGFLMFVAAVSFVILSYRERDALNSLVFDELDDWTGWAALISLLFTILILFVCFHSDQSLSEFSTHSEQYLWVTTAAFLRGWAPVMVILLAVGAGEIAAAMIISRNDSSRVFNTCCISHEVVHFRIYLAFVAIHLLNIVAVVATNSAYVYATVNGLPHDQLFAIQFFLGCFKLAWNGTVIPWFLRSAMKEVNTTNSRVFMSLFSFIGGPFISTFFTASNCFLYVVSQQASLTSMIAVPKFSCTSSCEFACDGIDCSYGCQLGCQSNEISVTTRSTPSWNYSYQCSSTLLLNYVPVMIASMIVSGLMLSCLVLQVCLKSPLLASSCIRYIFRSLLPGHRFDIVQLGRFFRVKSLVNVTTMLTFGFASPLLGVLVVLDTVSWHRMWQVLVNNQREYLRVNSEPDDLSRFTDLLNNALREKIPSPLDSLVALFFIGLFWSLFVFDMIGDVHGDLAGGLSMLVPLILGAMIWSLRRFRKSDSSGRDQIVISVTTPGFELGDDLFMAKPAPDVEVTREP